MHPATESLLKFFDYEHLSPELQAISAPCCALAHAMAEHLEGPEATVGIRKLLEAKDCFVRAAL